MSDNAGSWFSTRVRLVAVVEGRGASHQMECVHVFRATEWESAFQRALELGRSHEEGYTNEAGNAVRWTLTDVVSLDLLRTDDLDGAEVYSEMTEVDPGNDPPLERSPERSQPTQTL